MNQETLIIDIETTGLIPTTTVPGKRKGTTKKQSLSYEEGFMKFPYIVSIAWKIIVGADENELGYVEKETNHYILNQEGREIPKEASDIHGITTEITNKSEYKFSDIIKKLINVGFSVGESALDCDIVVGHGIYFDTSIIKANVLREVEENGMPEETYELITEMLHKNKRIDTMRSSTKIMGGKWPKLSDLYYKIFRKGFNAHSAKEDVEATFKCYKWLLKKGIVPSLQQLKEKAKEKENIVNG